jgi:phosphoribosylformylglycinamidine cyclo-ligase
VRVSQKEEGLTYGSAGVNIDAGERLVGRIRGLADATRRAGVVGHIGGFASLFSLKDCGAMALEDPLLVSSTDGVGTKLRIAFDSGVHNTVGIDLVAMCVNDLLTCGAEPLFFLDYFATGRLDEGVAAQVISGISEGCRQAECALVGGETAEMPSFYGDGEYDIAGFSVGVVDRSRLVDGRNVRSGDRIIGVHSNGLHSNGYSLARKALLEKGGLSLTDRLPGSSETLQDILLRPTPVYRRAVKSLLQQVEIRAMAHITGGGIPGNLPRVLPAGVEARIDPSTWPVPSVFNHIAEIGKVERHEMLRTFNMGLGLILVVPRESENVALNLLRDADHEASSVGTIEASSDPQAPAAVVFSKGA